jgi:geranylgeranyl diphosphate synthase type II
MNLRRYLAGRVRLVERGLGAAVPPGRAELRRAMRYSLLAGGKRLRPILVLAAAEAVGGRARAALPFACGVELIHTYSLIHDDLPSMDDDDVRRGKPTSHRVFGEALAILTGDALLTEAFRLMASARSVPAARVQRAIAEVAAAAGEAGMVGGQALDVAATGKATPLPAVASIHRMKTGALFRVSLRVGAIVAGASPAALRRLTAYGEHLGLAFQIVDDVLDAEGAPEADGRTDRALGKATYPGVLGLDGAIRHAERERDAALAAVGPLGERAEPLAALVAYIVARARPSSDATASPGVPA